jgi:NADH-quinone oxidoreductase subunit L
MTLDTLIWLIPLPPLLAFGLITLFTYRSKGLSHTLAVGGALLSWAASMVVVWRAFFTPDLGQKPFVSAVNWFPTGNSWFSIGVQIDPLSTVVLFFVAWTIAMIFIYSIGYHNYGQPVGDADHAGFPPHGATVTDAHGHEQRVPSVEPMYSRFFAMLSLFAFAMYFLVVSDNLLSLYIGWEIMGLCSYLLIGFWYGKESARAAAIKAFITTRVGDVFMLLGIAYLYSATGTLNYRAIFADPAVMNQLIHTASYIPGLSVAAMCGLLLFIGTVGKSAQWPLHVWLPDAMEGPTPVSAMIHAATMVSAGVYLAIRIFPLITAGWTQTGQLTTPMLVVGFIGSFTALFAATIAVAQDDIKRVLAYSTISQLGFMIAAVGIGAYAAAAFHLVTHAFFKALLFLGSGSVIHGMEHGELHTGEHIDPQNMYSMGGLRKKMPVTFWTFLIGGLALSGFPIVTAGFWSKDAILAGAFDGGYWLVFLVLAVAALLTAIYTMRQITLTFLGQPRTQSAANARESKLTMTLPLTVLAFFAVTLGWIGIPVEFPGIGGSLPDYFTEFVDKMAYAVPAVEPAHSLVPLFTSLVVALGGLYLGWLIYRRVKSVDQPDPLALSLNSVFTVLKKKYYFDEAYDFLFVRPAYWVAETFTSAWMDRGVIDGFINGVARASWWLGGILRERFDVPVINQGADALSNGVRGWGFSLRRVQSGRVQQYMITALLVALVFGILFFYFLSIA